MGTMWAGGSTLGARQPCQSVTTQSSRRPSYSEVAMSGVSLACRLAGGRSGYRREPATGPRLGWISMDAIAAGVGVKRI